MIEGPVSGNDGDDPFKEDRSNDAVDEEGVKEVDGVAHHPCCDDPAVGEGFAKAGSHQDGEKGEDEDEGFEVDGGGGFHEEEDGGPGEEADEVPGITGVVGADGFDSGGKEEVGEEEAGQEV